jgi:glucose uptake protein GlcU
LFNKIAHSDGMLPRRKRMMILSRAIWLLALVGGVVFLAKALVSDALLYVMLGVVWLIIAGGGFILSFEDKWYR